MDDESRFLASAVGLGLLAVGHAAITWGPAAAGRFALVAVAVAFVAEVAVIRAGLLVHHTTPTVAGVPLAALAGWAGAIYLSSRVAALVVPPSVVPLAAALLATATNVLSDPQGVENGLWTYPPSRLSRPRYRAVPWWNFVGWFVLTAVVSWLGAPT